MSAGFQRAITGDASEHARRRLLSRLGEPLFFSDWERVVFIHYEVDAGALQQCVPFPLDLYESKAYVSIVAFDMRRLRPRIGGRFSEWLFRPISRHGLLNVRTYVRCRNEPGIYFLAEWLSNRLSAILGPRTFGLPYRLGRLKYEHFHEKGELRGAVADRNTSHSLAYSAMIDTAAQFHSSAPDSLEEFLLERYTAFTCCAAKLRLFRIWHTPWLQSPIEVSVLEDSLLTTTWPWLKTARLVGANYSPGLLRVWMGRPLRLKETSTVRRGSISSAFYEFP